VKQKVPALKYIKQQAIKEKELKKLLIMMMKKLETKFSDFVRSF
jgi:hypothetical protein